MKFGVFDYIEGSDAPLHKTYEERIELHQGARSRRLLRLSPVRASRDAAVDDAVADASFSRRRRARPRGSGSAPCFISCRSTIRCGSWKSCACSTISAAGGSISASAAASRRHEFEAFGEDFEQSGGRLRALPSTCSIRASRRDRIDYSCDRFAFKDTPVVIKPLQRPHPPFWYGLRGDHGPLFAARHGMNGVTLGPDDRIAAHPAGVPQALGGACRGAQAPELAGADAARRRHARHVRRRQRRRGEPGRETGARDAGSRISPGCGRCAARSRRSRLPPTSSRRRPPARWWSAARTPSGASSTAQAERCGHNYLVLLLAFGSLTPRAADALAEAVPDGDHAEAGER